MRFTVRGLLVYVAFVGATLALARLPFLAVCAALVGVVTAANLVLPTRTWRFVAWGAVAGIAAMSVALGCYLEFGIQGPRSYTDGRLEAVDFWRPYVVQVG